MERITVDIAKLKKLIDEKADGNCTRFSQLLGRSDTFIGKILKRGDISIVDYNLIKSKYDVDIKGEKPKESNTCICSTQLSFDASALACALFPVESTVNFVRLSYLMGVMNNINGLFGAVAEGGEFEDTSLAYTLTKLSQKIEAEMNDCMGNGLEVYKQTL